jgi:hypothetical protein
MDTLKQQAERSPIDTIAGHLDSKIEALRVEMLTSIANLKEMKSHDLVKVSERQDMLSVNINRRLTDLERHVEACVPRMEYTAAAAAQEMAMHSGFRDSARAVEVALTTQGKAVDAAFAAQEKAIDAAFASQEKAVASAMTAAERAVGKSEMASEKRFDAVNEFRAQLSDQASTFLPRAEFDRVTSAITEKIDASNKTFSERLDDLRMSRDTTSGKSAGMNAGWAVLLGLASLVATVLMVATFFRR